MKYKKTLDLLDKWLCLDFTSQSFETYYNEYNVYIIKYTSALCNYMIALRDDFVRISISTELGYCALSYKIDESGKWHFVKVLSNGYSDLSGINIALCDLFDYGISVRYVEKYMKQNYKSFKLIDKFEDWNEEKDDYLIYNITRKNGTHDKVKIKLDCKGRYYTHEYI